MSPGLAINPDIPVEKLFPYLDQCDYVVLMSVFAGFGGQKFIEATYNRVETLKVEIERQGVECLIQVDGGVSAANSAKLAELGADILVAGSAVFKADDPQAVIAEMKA
jgi:ribulose-phosphate 3-epimerase